MVGSFFGLIVFGISQIAWANQSLIWIPGGTIEANWQAPMAKAEQRSSPILKISVPGFYTMEHAVTVREYREFLEKNPKWKKETVSETLADKNYLKQVSSSEDSAPITYVSWFAAKAFCKQKEMRLPTVAEWEYMAAASEKQKNANQDEKFVRRILDWYGEPQGESRRKVKSTYKNVYGVWDMHGLVWEWVDDFNSIFVTGESREDSSFNKDMFCGAGSLNSLRKEDYAAFMRFAFRSGLKGNSTVWNLGFRCVKDKL